MNVSVNSQAIGSVVVAVAAIVIAINSAAIGPALVVVLATTASVLIRYFWTGKSV